MFDLASRRCLRAFTPCGRSSTSTTTLSLFDVEQGMSTRTHPYFPVCGTSKVLPCWISLVGLAAVRADRPYSVLFQHLLPFPCCSTNEPAPSPISLHRAGQFVRSRYCFLIFFLFPYSICHARWQKIQTSDNNEQSTQSHLAKRLSQPTRPVTWPRRRQLPKPGTSTRVVAVSREGAKKGLSCGSLAYCLPVCLAPLKSKHIHHLSPSSF